MAQLQLITIPMSHYCEKARWALERLGLDYHEERHLQGFHYPRTFIASGGPQVPVLIDGPTVITDSTAILKHLDHHAMPETRLYPSEPAARRRVEALEDLFDEVLGVESRRWVYACFMPMGMRAWRIAGQGTSRIERLLMPIVHALIGRHIARVLDLHPDSVAAGLARSRGIVQDMDALLADGRPFLDGDRFSAADLTLACMLAPFIMPPEYGIRLPRPDELPGSIRETVEEFRNTLTGRHAMRLYRYLRRSPVDAPTGKPGGRQTRHSGMRLTGSRPGPTIPHRGSLDHQ